MRRFTLALAIGLAALTSTVASADTIKVLTAGAYKQVVVALAPGFEASTGHKLVIDNDTAGALAKRIAGGESFDVLISTPASLQELAGTSKVVPASVAILAKVGIGVAVKKGAPRPPLGDVDQFKQALFDARKIAMIDPASGGSSGIYLDKLFTQWGIGEAIRAKAVLVPGGLVATRLVDDQADLAIHQISEILPVEGAELVGPLPEAIQNYTTYVGGVSATSANRPAAQAFIETLAGERARAVLASKGMTSGR